LVAGGELVTSLAKQHGVKIVPIDSEHSAIFQCLLASSKPADEVEKIILTGSGGPFRGKKWFDLRSVTPEQAVKHPTWNMGQKISVDSATLMNKGFEVIEAVRLFGVSPDNIEVVIHKESVIHSLVRFRDGAVIAQMSYPDMRLPISYALTYPGRVYPAAEPLDLASLGTLDFEEPDTETFKCLDYAYTALEMGGNATAALNGANEVAVERFLKREIGFCDIPRCVETALLGFAPTDNDLDGIIDADLQGRRIAAAVKKSW
ncbi:MAG: 1-deoxy-D-xylulose-5-phosphate reductoisomerase, partial [Clostridia bacterium]|nr:1-deoxy-D-xylulose-5-phosphate reductoisomerase [Clostridia bacterium]